MTQYTSVLKLALQETGENDDLWGDVANAAVFQLLENSVAKIETVLVTAGNVTLVYDNGATNINDARAGILDITGAPGATNDVIIPEGAGISRFYLVRNSTTDSSDVRIITPSGTGATVPNGEIRWVLCDGVNVDFVNAGVVTQATNSTNADNLLSEAPAYASGELFVRTDLGVATSKTQLFTKGQNVERIVLDTSGSVTVTNGLSNAFVCELTGNITLSNPPSLANADGQVIRITFIQPSAGGPYDITWGSSYHFPAGARPSLTQVADAVDYAAFEYVSDYPGGGRWVGNIISDIK